MDNINGRMGSEAPSSSSSDFYATAPPNQQSDTWSTDPLPTDDAGQDVAVDGSIDTQDEDSSAEMDLSDSRSPSPELPPNGTTRSELSGAQQDGISQPPKRKLSQEDHVGVNGTIHTTSEGAKRPKLSRTPSVDAHKAALKALDLPVELWQQIFLHLSPNDLARCVRVCRTLKSCLTESKASPALSKTEAKDFSKVRVFDSEAIWAHSRKSLHPNMPRPLSRLTELQMLQLIGNKMCQFCGRAPMQVHPTSPFNCGPGTEGVRVLWVFGIRSCGKCIEDNTIKDIDVLTSKAAPLRSGLPHCFLTPDLHFIPEIQRTQLGGIPAHLRVAKVYYQPDVQHIVEEYNDAVGLGAGAAEEWKKGLSARGREAMTDAARWEQWEGQMPPGTDLSQLLREYDLSFSNPVGEAYSSAAVPNGTQLAMTMNGSHPLPQQVQFPHPASFAQSPSLYQPAYMMPNNTNGPFYGYQPTYSLPAKPAKAKTAQDVEETIRVRRADIERRCQELNPPLSPGALPHMPAFQATMQIAQPLTDEFWESYLKPRILTERDAAEEAERLRQDHMVWLQASMPHTTQDEPFTRPAKEVYDKDFEDAQEPLRRKLSEYADDFINNQWMGGQLDKTNSPVFAVKVIEFVDRRYREDMLAGMLPPQENPSRRTKEGSPTREPFLSLHNMKWLYDNKIRPRTDVHGRELFLCSGCTDSKQPKWLAFEGLIQHYGAKHTTAFSQGNVVVHWQTAEWPSELPFVRDPTYYMKHDKKVSELKGHGRARRTPQANDTPFNAPASGRLLSENPFFSGQHQSPPATSGYYQPASEYPGQQYSQPRPQTGPYSWPQQTAASNDQQSESTYETQLNILCSDIIATWDSLAGVKEDVLLECIRVQTTIYHAVTRFEAKFGKVPTLDQLTDVLATKPDAKPVKEAQGLACKLCVAAQTDGSATYQSYYRRIQNVKLHNTSSLVSHFKIVHLGQNPRMSTSWATNMIELPEADVVSRVVRAPGMDDDKLATIAAAFPTAFPQPLPMIGYVTEQQVENQLAQKMLDRHFKKKGDPPRKKKKGQHGANGTPAREESEPLPEPREDEYDPRRPMALQMDNRTSPGLPSSAPRQGSAAFNFAPETLAALSHLNASSVPAQQPSYDNRAERSPSVGRAEPATQSMPDISQILAQLTSQPSQLLQAPQVDPPSHSNYAHVQAPTSQQTATPPDTTTSRSSSQPKHVYADPYGPPQRVSPRHYTDDRPPSSRYASQPAYRGSTEPVLRYDGHDSRPAQAYNARQFEHNRGQSYAEPTYPQSSHTPPRYRPVYEETPQYSPPAQYPPAYRPEPPAQYVQVQADRDRYLPPPPTYQYARPPPEHKYVDEHGREIRLVPVDAAPAPVQYMPHPMEQQQQSYARHAGPPPTAYAGSPTVPQYAPYPYEDRRPMYYEQPPPTGAPLPPLPQDQRFGYEDVARGSVPRR